MACSEDIGASMSLAQEATREFRFHSRESLEGTMQNEAQRKFAGEGFNDVRVAFTCVPPSIIDQLCSESDQNYRLEFFDKDEEYITLTMLGREHEEATFIVEQMVQKALDRAGMDSAMSLVRSARAPYTRKTRWGKMPDASFQLKRRYHGDLDLEDWPQVVIETASSERERDILADVRFWLEEGGLAVRLVLTVRVTRAQFRLRVYTQGRRAENYTRLGEIIARRGDAGFAVQPGSRDSITVPFSLLFFRPPGEGESNPELLASDFMSMKDQLEDLLAENLPSRRRPPPPASPNAEIGEELPKNKFPRGKRRKL